MDRFQLVFRSRRKEDTVVAVENRYQREYENKLDPFQSFSQAERKRKYAGLSVAEKVRTIQYYYESP